MLSDEEWAALTAAKKGEPIPAGALEKLLALKLVAATPRGETRLSGLGNEALTLRRHGFQSSVEKLLSTHDTEPEEATEPVEPAEPLDSDELPPDED